MPHLMELGPAMADPPNNVGKHIYNAIRDAAARSNAKMGVLAALPSPGTEEVYALTLDWAPPYPCGAGEEEDGMCCPNASLDFLMQHLRLNDGLREFVLQQSQTVVFPREVDALPDAYVHAHSESPGVKEVLTCILLLDDYASDTFFLLTGHAAGSYGAGVGTPMPMPEPARQQEGDGNPLEGDELYE